MNTREVTDMISARVHQTEPDAKVLLFGSRARGEARPDSDWDVMVLLNDQSKAGRWEIHEKLWDLGLDVNAEINPVVYRFSEWENKSFTPFYKNVMSEGIEL
jgi:predicted nucleotidyltransferase